MADMKVKGIIFYGFPLHPQGKPSVERAEHLKDVKIPMLFCRERGMNWPHGI
jgi:predicted alpha/beta-hydrolase family hydrolase